MAEEDPNLHSASVLYDWLDLEEKDDGSHAGSGVAIILTGNGMTVMGEEDG